MNPMNRQSNFIARLLIICFGIFVIYTVNTGCQSADKSGKAKKNIVFLVSQDPDNYEADRTIPVFADQLQDKFKIGTRVLKAEGERTSSVFTGIEALDSADLLVVFCRRLALQEDQMNRIQNFVKEGNPVLGIRTAHHAFSVVSEDIPAGYEDWPGFAEEVLGCENRGYGPVEAGTEINVVTGQVNHPIIQGVSDPYWRSDGNLYKVAPLLDPNAQILLTGLIPGSGQFEPVAWTRKNDFGGDVFYTSLGHPSDFDEKDYIKVLNQAVAWLLHQK